MTPVNPRQRLVAADQGRPGGPAVLLMPDMPVAGTQPKPPLEVWPIWPRFMMRGGRRPVQSIRHAEPVRLAVKQSAVMLQGALLSARGYSEAEATRTHSLEGIAVPGTRHGGPGGGWGWCVSTSQHATQDVAAARFRVGQHFQQLFQRPSDRDDGQCSAAGLSGAAFLVGT